MAWVGKITLACPSGRVVRKLTGSSADVIKRASKFDARVVGDGCSVTRIEIVRRGTGSGAEDRFEGRRTRRAMWAPDPGLDSHLMWGTHRHVSSFGGARRRRRR